MRKREKNLFDEIKEKAIEAAQAITEALDTLLNPAPAPVPIRVRPPSPPQRRR